MVAISSRAGQPKTAEATACQIGVGEQLPVRWSDEQVQSYIIKCCGVSHLRDMCPPALPVLPPRPPHQLTYRCQKGTCRPFYTYSYKLHVTRCSAPWELAPLPILSRPILSPRFLLFTLSFRGPRCVNRFFFQSG